MAHVPHDGHSPSDGSFPVEVEVAGTASSASLEVEMLLGRLESVTDPAERARMLLQVGTVMRDDLGDESQALDAFLEAWANDPTDEVLDAMEPLLRSHERFKEALESTRTLSTTVKDGKRGLLYMEAIVRWLTKEVPDPDLARQWVDRIRVVDSTHAYVHMVQAAVSRAAGDYKRELDELDLAALSFRRKDDRARMHLMLAGRWREERALNRAEAKKQYGNAHRLFPKMMDPLVGLEQLAIEEKDPRALADVLRKQAEADVDDDERVQILLRLAKVEEEEFRKPELAARTLQRVVDLDPDWPGVLDHLERCYRASRQWNELADVLERAAIGDTDAATRAERFKRLGEVLESKLGDLKAALETYQRLVGLFPEDETIVGELARLAEKTNDVQLAINCRERLAELVEDPTVRARQHVIAGQLLTPIDPLQARRHFESAAKADPSNAAAWTALLWDARSAEDVDRTARYLEERAMSTDMPRTRAAAFVELAELRTKLGDADGARAAFEEAAKADPTNETAAIQLINPFMAEGRYEEAEPLCDVVLAGGERDKDYERVFAVRRAQTEIALALGKPDRALASAIAAFDIRRDDPHAREALVAAASDLRADPQVLTAKEHLLAIADDPDELPVESRTALADVLVLMGEGDRAASLYDEVLSQRGDDVQALAGLAQHHAASGNRVAALALRRQIARGIKDPDERYAAFIEVAEAFVAKAQNDELASEVYEEARAIRPRDLPLLHKLLALYQKLARWQSLFDVLRSIAEVDADPTRRSQTYFTMAQIAQHELMDRGAALSLFEQALDANPSRLESFERIASMLTESKDWPGLEQMYKRMILRGMGNQEPKVQHALYQQLGILYRDRIGAPALAIQALSAAVQLRPDDEATQSMLRELLAATGQTGGAVQITLERILRDPMDPTPYPALFDLLVSQGARDRALCVASAIKFLGIQHASAAGMRASFPQPPIEGIVMDLGPEGYRELLHHELDPAMTEIFEAIAPALIEVALARLPLKSRLTYPGPALKGHDFIASMTARTAKLLGAPAPKLFQRNTPGPGFAAAPTKPPSLLVYPPALGGLGREILSFMVGKRVAELTPPLLARALCPSITELKALAGTAARIATRKTEPGDQPIAERLSREQIARVSAAVEHSMSTSGKLDVYRWSQLADVTTSRAGLLLCGDLEAARAALAHEPQAPGDLTPREKMRELVLFFLGDGSANLRRRLGVALS